jgi:hypothetical protein
MEQNQSSAQTPHDVSAMDLRSFAVRLDLAFQITETRAPESAGCLQNARADCAYQQHRHVVDIDKSVSRVDWHHVYVMTCKLHVNVQTAPPPRSRF